MASKKRLIDANELLEKHTCDVYGAYDDSCMVQAVFVPYIKGAPTVDAVEVVRCKNCICLFNPDDHQIGCSILGGMTEITEESYCSKGMTEAQWMELHGHELEEEVGVTL